MATTFKTFLNNDVISSRTLLNEAIPLTGTIVSGTYGTFGSETNIKNYSHGMFQSVFDYPYLSSSANHIFDITCGYHATSSLSSSTNPSQRAKKINVYNEMAQVLAGFDENGAMRKVDEDGDLHVDGSTTITAMDAYCDPQMIRALSLTGSPAGIIHSEFDDFLKYNEQDLIDARIIYSSRTPDENGHIGLLNITGLQRLHNGAIWQLYTRLETQGRELTALQGQLHALTEGT